MGDIVQLCLVLFSIFFCRFSLCLWQLSDRYSRKDIYVMGKQYIKQKIASPLHHQQSKFVV